MRVVAGSAKGKKLLSVPGDTTRPILDRVKTALFDVIRPQLSETVMLDLFAGSGSVGIEALSQGAKHCTFLDLSAKAADVIKKNLIATGLQEKSLVKNTDAFTFLRNTSQSYDLIFIAPPQYKSLWLEALRMIAERPAIVANGGTIIVQIDPKEYESSVTKDFAETKQKKYGNTLLVFYEKV